MSSLIRLLFEKIKPIWIKFKVNSLRLFKIIGLFLSTFYANLALENEDVFYFVFIISTHLVMVDTNVLILRTYFIDT